MRRLKVGHPDYFMRTAMDRILTLASGNHTRPNTVQPTIPRPPPPYLCLRPQKAHHGQGSATAPVVQRALRGRRHRGGQDTHREGKADVSSRLGEDGAAREVTSVVLVLSHDGGIGVFDVRSAGVLSSPLSGYWTNRRLMTRWNAHAWRTWYIDDGV